MPVCSYGATARVVKFTTSLDVVCYQKIATKLYDCVTRNEERMLYFGQLIVLQIDFLYLILATLIHCCGMYNNCFSSRFCFVFFSQYPIPMKRETQGRTDLYISSWLKSQPRDKVLFYVLEDW